MELVSKLPISIHAPFKIEGEHSYEGCIIIISTAQLHIEETPLVEFNISEDRKRLDGKESIAPMLVH